MKKIDRLQKTIQISRKSGGTLRMSETLSLGVHRRDLYLLRDQGQFEVLDRGLYRQADMPHLRYLILFTLRRRFPAGSSA